MPDNDHDHEQETEPATTSAVRLVVFIDAENVPASYIGSALARLGQAGTVIEARCYGDERLLSSPPWSAATAVFGLVAVARQTGRVGKNLSDISIVVDAMELVYQGAINGVAVISNDSDFEPLARHVRAKGGAYYQFGRYDVSPVLREACTQFFVIETIVLPQNQQPTSWDPSLRAGASLVSPLLLSLVLSCGDRDGWVSVSKLKKQLAAMDTPINPRAFGCANLLELLKRLGRFEVEQLSHGDSRVRSRAHARRRERRKARKMQKESSPD